MQIFLEKIVKKVDSFVKRERWLRFIREALAIFIYKQDNIYKFMYYISATAILIMVSVIAFFVFSVFNCLSAVNSLNQVNLISVFFYVLSILATSFILSPFLNGLVLMIFKDAFENMKSNFSDFLFFIHSFDQSKKRFLFKGYLVTTIFMFIVSLVMLFYFGVYSLVQSYIVKLGLFSVILLSFFKVLVILIIFALIFPLLMIFWIVFFNYEKEYLIKGEQISEDFSLGYIKDFLKKIFSVFVYSLKLYFREFANLFRFGILIGIGFITVIGFLITFPLGWLGIAVSVRKYL
ncbi:MAG: hypothetical protein ACK4GJ_03420 [bacterium]